jgi:predicted Fe-Mo cluster-binding NifX family protein
MRIAVPTDGKKGKKEVVAEHFGRCETFTVFDEKGNFVDTIENTSQHMGGSGMPPELLKKNKIDVLVCQGLGPNAISMCEGFGIQVYLAHADTAEHMFNLWLDKKAKRAGNEDGCKDHQH